MTRSVWTRVCAYIYSHIYDSWLHAPDLAHMCRRVCAAAYKIHLHRERERERDTWTRACVNARRKVWTAVCAGIRHILADDLQFKCHN